MYLRYQYRLSVACNFTALRGGLARRTWQGDQRCSGVSIHRRDRCSCCTFHICLVAGSDTKFDGNVARKPIPAYLLVSAIFSLNMLWSPIPPPHLIQDSWVLALCVLQRSNYCCCHLVCVRGSISVILGCTRHRVWIVTALSSVRRAWDHG